MPLNGVGLVGTVLRVEFDGQMFPGRVEDYNKATGFFRIAYQDGDSEEVDQLKAQVIVQRRLDRSAAAGFECSARAQPVLDKEGMPGRQMPVASGTVAPSIPNSPALRQRSSGSVPSGTKARSRGASAPKANTALRWRSA